MKRSGGRAKCTSTCHTAQRPGMFIWSRFNVVTEDTMSVGLEMSPLFQWSYENNLEITGARREPISFESAHAHAR